MLSPDVVVTYFAITSESRSAADIAVARPKTASSPASSTAASALAKRDPSAARDAAGRWVGKGKDSSRVINNGKPPTEHTGGQAYFQQM
jgi:hypothetical protein